jgi:hypothetical protein
MIGDSGKLERGYLFDFSEYGLYQHFIYFQEQE